MACASGACGSGGAAGGSGCGSGRCGTDDCPSTLDADWLAGIEPAGDESPFPIVEVAFKGGRRGHFRVTGETRLHAGEPVIVEADRGIDYGTVHLGGPMVRLRLRSRGQDENGEYPAIVRRATPDDTTHWEANRERDTETFLVGRRTIDRMNLTMKLVDVEWQLDGRKVTFYFTAEQRVDFRELVRRLARRFRTRVELRQIGARDEAARIGGIGSCGRELCCSTWLQEFRPVSTQAAKSQNLPLNPVRLSGQCGRLKCCLNYELEQYLQALARFPSVDTPITIASGMGVIRKVDIFRERLWVQLEGGEWTDIGLDVAREALGIAGDTPPAEPRD
jgi:cell fate regulator YaaT (PSP1 superfamily)